MASLRFLIAGGLLYAWSIRRGDREGDRPGRKQWVAAGIVGGLLFLIGNAGVAWAEKRVDTGVASLIIAAVPLWMALFDRVACGAAARPRRRPRPGDRLRRRRPARRPERPGHIEPSAIRARLLGSLAWAAGSLYSRRAPLPRRPLVSAAMQMLAGGVMLTVVAAVSGELGRVHPAQISGESWLGLAYLIVAGSLVGFTAYMWLLRAAPTSLVGTYAYVNPVVAVFLGWAFLGERLGWRTLVGGGIIVAAVALIVGRRPRGPRRRRAGAGSPSRGARWLTCSL